MVSKLAKQEAAAERDAAAAAAKADNASGLGAVPASTNIAGNAAIALQQVHTWPTFQQVQTMRPCTDKHV